MRERGRLRERIIRRRSDSTNSSRDNLLSDRGTRFVGEGEGGTSASRKGERENGLVGASRGGRRGSYRERTK